MQADAITASLTIHQKNQTKCKNVVFIGRKKVNIVKMLSLISLICMQLYHLVGRICIESHSKKKASNELPNILGMVDVKSFIFSINANYHPEKRAVKIHLYTNNHIRSLVAPLFK